MPAFSVDHVHEWLRDPYRRPAIDLHQRRWHLSRSTRRQRAMPFADPADDPRGAGVLHDGGAQPSHRGLELGDSDHSQTSDLGADEVPRDQVVEHAPARSATRETSRAMVLDADGPVSAHGLPNAPVCRIGFRTDVARRARAYVGSRRRWRCA